MRPLRTLLATVLASAAAVTLAPPAQAATTSAPLRTVIADLPVAAEVRTGYDRDLFPHWKDADGDCQDARAEVLVRQSTSAVGFTSASRCTVATGTWTSYYDRRSWTAASDLDIDHVVALAEAWDSGARSWTTARRQAYANDLGDVRSLIAVTDDVNQSKGDQDPSTWLPTYDTCRFITAWTAVKVRWSLTVDQAEKAALTREADGCANTTLTVTTA